MTATLRAALILLGTLVVLSLCARTIRSLRLWRRRAFYVGKVALITGASRGLGRALALALARRGAHLALAARSTEELEAVAGLCRAFEVPVLVVPCDVTDPAQLSTLVSRVFTEFEHIDLLFNNAGIIGGGRFIEQPEAAVFKQIETNVLVPMHLVRLIAPHMVTRGSGWIINQASILGRHSMPYFTAYSASKRALIGFGEGLRRELYGSGVYVLTVVSGFVSTAMVHGTEQVLRRYGVWIMQPDYVARRILDALVLGQRELHLYGIERLAVWIGTVSPALADVLWHWLAPADFAQIAARQHTE